MNLILTMLDMGVDYLTDWFVYVLCNCTKYCCTDDTKILFTFIEHDSEPCISQYLCNWLK